MSFNNLIVESMGGLTKVVINRPKVLNALNNETIAELTDLFLQIEKNKDIRGIIITGAGEKAFVAGADVSELARLSAMEAKKLSERGQTLLNLIETMGKPVAAAINGYALGGGLELAMACSFRYAAEGAKMGQPEINLGLIPGYGGTQRLSRLIGRGRALELLFTGNPIGADEAYRLGLVNKVTPLDQLMREVEKVMEAIVQKSPIMLRYLLQTVSKGMNMTMKDGLALEANLFSLCFDSEDMREGTQAFLDKRKPEFKGQ